MRRALLLLPSILITACGDSPATPVCEPVRPGPRVADVRVHLDVPPGPDLDHVRDDLARHLETMWGAPVDVAYGAPANAAAHEVRLTVDAAVEGLSIRSDETATTIAAGTRADLAFAAYVWLETIGARFFHPLETYVPRHGEIAVPVGLDIQRRPMTQLRGLQPHLLHPIEWFDALNGDDFEAAKRLIDWLVATGHNHLQWPIMKTMDIERWKPHAAAIIDYGRERHVSIGVVLSLFGGTALQNNYSLADDDEDWQPELEGRLDDMLTLPWDHIELVMGEFLSRDPEYLIELLDHTMAYVAASSPSTTLAVTNHIGDYENLYVQFRGNEEYFYFLPKYADERVINTVHTVFFFDLFRDWGMYGHENFAGHRDFLFDQLNERTIRYKPESAYWVTADVDVPVFLPEFVNARWLDVHRLHETIENRGLPPLDGHTMFTSGHEWGYWMTDYLTAHVLWRPEAERRVFVDHYAETFGTCAARVGDTFDAYMDLQTEYLFDQRLVPYLSGEDLHDDLGAVAGFTTHPPRVPFETAFAYDRSQAAAFRADVLTPLGEMADRSKKHIDDVAAVCAGATEEMQPWCDELLDGIEIVALRLRHSKALYEAVLSRRRSDAAAKLAEAEAIRAEARIVVDRRAKGYRFDLEALTGPKPNPTIYPFGYLRQAHHLCYWTRQALQAEHLVTKQEPALVTSLPSCLD